MVNKYFAKPMAVDGIRFDSGSEGKRYLFLRQMQKKGMLNDLKTQVVFTIAEPLEIKYIADFTYIKDGNLVVEDVKNPVLAKGSIFIMKKKLMFNVHGIDVKVVLPKDVNIDF